MVLLFWLVSVVATVVIGSYKGRSALVSVGLGVFLGPIGIVSLLLSPIRPGRVAGERSRAGEIHSLVP
jgi:hypothetical protein